MINSNFFFSSRRRHTRLQGDWSSDVCSSDLTEMSATLSSAARQIVADAAGRARATNTRSIRIEGRSNAIGSPAANQRLAEHRAEAVAAELAKDGLDRATFGQVWIGETGSGDTGVADRRVDIVLER